MRIETVRQYASGKSPFLGLPVFSVAEGRYITAVFRNEHLKVAVSAPVTKVYYDEREHVLVLNGSKRAEYRLLDLKHSAKSWLPWRMKEEIEAWSRSQRGRKNRRTNTPNERRLIKLQEAVWKLERARDKIYCHAPVSPLRLADYDREPLSQSWRDQETRWRDEKPMRRKLGQLAHSPRKTWKQFYADVAAIIGREVGTAYRHDRVCNRKGGPDIIDYLKFIPKHIHMASKGHQHGDVWNPWEYDGDTGLNSFQRHRKAQLEYLMQKREQTALQSQIDTHKAEIIELEGERKAS